MWFVHREANQLSALIPVPVTGMREHVEAFLRLLFSPRVEEKLNQATVTGTSVEVRMAWL